MTDVMEPVLLSSWPRDDLRDEELTLEQELEKLRAEKRALQMRVLGVDELARLLQDRTSELRITEEKNKRLEVAVVRLENRCSNFEKKLKSQNAAPPRSGQMPLIPGPSRQILDSLMKENAELKKVINKHTSKGPTSYLEAVKTTQLEEMIEQQRQDIEFYKAQLTSLGLSENGEDEKAVSMPVPGEPPGTSNTRALKLKVAKLQQTMRVKDRFCSLLSERVSLLEKQLSEQISPPQPPSLELDQQPHSMLPTSLKGVPDVMSVETQVDGEEAQSRPEELEKEMKQLQEKLAAKEVELGEKDDEIKQLQQKTEDLTLYNKTLVDERRDSTVGARRSTSELQDVEKLQSELRETKAMYDEMKRKLDRAEVEKRNLEDLIENNDVQRAMIESKLTSSEKESNEKITKLKDQIDMLQEDLASEKNKSKEILTKYFQLDAEMKRFKSSNRVTPVVPPSQAYMNRPVMLTGGNTTPAYATEPYYYGAIVNRDNGNGKQTPATSGQQRCMPTSNVDTITRSQMIMARDVPDPPAPDPTHHQRPQNLVPTPARPTNPSTVPVGGQHQFQIHPTTAGMGMGPPSLHGYPAPMGGQHHHNRPPPHTIMPPHRGYTSPVTNPASSMMGGLVGGHTQFIPSRSYPVTTGHPSMQQGWGAPQYDPNSSLGSLGYVSGTPSSSSFADAPQGQGATPEGQQQQQQGYHGHNPGQQ